MVGSGCQWGGMDAIWSIIWLVTQTSPAWTFSAVHTRLASGFDGGREPAPSIEIWICVLRAGQCGLGSSGLFPRTRPGGWGDIEIRDCNVFDFHGCFPCIVVWVETSWCGMLGMATTSKEVPAFVLLAHQLYQL